MQLPVVFKDAWCFDCPYLVTVNPCNIEFRCSLLDCDLDYYDGPLAACQYPDNEDSVKAALKKQESDNVSQTENSDE